jgi:hypothetical protein
MTADGVVPVPTERVRVREIARMYDLAGLPLVVGVNGSAVVINGRTLGPEGQETFAQIFVRACHIAGRHLAS